MKSIRDSITMLPTHLRVLAMLTLVLTAMLIGSLFTALWIVPGGRWIGCIREGAFELEVASRPSVYRLIEFRGQMRLMGATFRPPDAYINLQFSTPAEFSARRLVWPTRTKHQGCVNASRIWTFPILWVLVVTGSPLTFFVARMMRRRRSAHCVNCGYDLRHSTMTRCPECGYSESKDSKGQTRLTKDSRGRKSIQLIGLLAIFAIFVTAFWMRSSYSNHRFEMKGVGEHLYLIDQKTGIVRIFHGAREIHRFDARVPLDEYTGDWLVGLSSPDPDEAIADE